MGKSNGMDKFMDYDLFCITFFPQFQSLPCPFIAHPRSAKFSSYHINIVVLIGPWTVFREVQKIMIKYEKQKIHKHKNTAD
jgi:hypothetical protein